MIIEIQIRHVKSKITFYQAIMDETDTPNFRLPFIAKAEWYQMYIRRLGKTRWFKLGPKFRHPYVKS